jgi:hypothetical protein
VLSRHKTQPGCELAALVKGRPVADRSDDRGCDQSDDFESAKYVNNNPKEGVTVVVSNLRPLVLPATLQVDYVDGTTARIRIPAEVWLSKGTASFIFKDGKVVESVTVDPDHVLPDDNRQNNLLKLP